ncbi:MAG: MFS transporter [Victivallaceae bacterium]|nr:MFS transporter [Victivallaceae bacterium]
MECRRENNPSGRGTGAVVFFASMLLVYAFCLFQRVAVTNGISRWLQDVHGLSVGQVATLGSCFFYVYAGCMLFTGLLSDKFGGRRVMAFSGFLLALGAIGFPLSCGNFPAMCLMRVLVGMGSSGIYLAMLHETDAIFGHSRFSTFFGIILGFSGIGSMIGTAPFSAGCERYGTVATLLFFGLLLAVSYAVFVALGARFGKSSVRPEPLSLRPYAAVLKRPAIWSPAFVNAIVFGCYSVVAMAFGQRIIFDVTGMSLVSSGNVVLGVTAGSTLVCFGLGAINRILRGSRRAIGLLASLIMLADTMLLALSLWLDLPAWCFVVAFIIFGVTNALSMACTMTVQELGPKAYATTSASVVNSLDYLMAGIFAQAVGLVLDRFVSPEQVKLAAASGMVVSYPREAYIWLFSLMLVPVAFSVFAAFRTRETGGRFVDDCQEDK